MFTRSALMALAALGLTAPAQAGDKEITPGPYFNPQPPRVPASTGAPNAAKWVEDASRFCAAIQDPTYQIDCLAERMAYLSERLKPYAGYADVSAELAKTSGELRGVTDRYWDSAKRSQSYAAAPGSSVGEQRTTRAVRAVDSARLAAAAAEARAIIARTETVLLRSSDTNPSVAPQIVRIAAAVGSNKVLLRSS